MQRRSPLSSLGVPFDADAYFATGGRAVVGHERAAGEDVSLENRKGSMRQRADSGASRMAADYGYITNSPLDADRMKTDAFVGPHKDSNKVFVINQKHPHTGKFNEHKVMLGYKDRKHALHDYVHSFADGLGRKRVQSIVEMDKSELRDWLRNGPHTKPVKMAEGGLTPRQMAAKLQAPEDQGAVSPSMEGVTEALQSTAAGVVPAAKAVGEYVTETPIRQMASDVGSVAGHMVEAAKENPAEFIGGMLPGIGNLYAAKDVAELKDKIAAAREAGDEETVAKLEKVLPLAAAGVVMPVGAGAAVRGAVKGVEKGAVRAAEESALTTGMKVLGKTKEGDYLVELPLNQIEHGEGIMPGGTMTWPGRFEKIKDYATRPTEMPPIDVVSPEMPDTKWMIADGSHRYEATKLKGENSIKAIISRNDPEGMQAVESLTRSGEEAATFAPKPVAQAFEQTPEPAVMRTDMVDEITRSIDASDGSVAKLPTTMGLGPMYVVDSGVTGLKKKDGFLLAETKNANAEKQLAGITPLLQEHPNMALDPEQWAQAMAKATGSQNVVAPPYRFAKAMQNGEYEQLLKTLTEGQIRDADAGFSNGKEFLNAYHSGAMGVEDTGKLFMWGMLSRGVDPFTHEGLFLDAFSGIEPWIKMAAEGKFTKEVAEGPYKEWAASTAPKGSGQAGAGAMHNLNAFGKDFLVKMGTPNAEGITPLQKLHDLMSNPDLSGRDIRREFAKTGEGVGIDNKVVSFIMLATGRDDVMVIDRIQLKNLWDDGRFNDINIWDGVSVPVVKTKDGIKRFPPTDEGRAAAKEFASKNDAKVENAAVTGSALAEATYGAKGILVYEAIEDALQKNVGDLYQKLGRPEAASPGRFHWETWVARSNQEASHGTIGSILEKTKGAENPLENIYSKQGDYQTYAYGAKYGRDAEGPYYMYPLSSGSEVRLNPQALAGVLEQVKNPKYGVVPKGFKVSETTGRPWYEREGVNRAKLDELIRTAADGSAGGQAGVVRKASGGEVSDGAGRARNGREADRGITRLVTETAIHVDDVPQRQLAYLIRLASGMNVPPERAAEFARQIQSKDHKGLADRFKKYGNAKRTLMRLNAILGGEAHKGYAQGGLFEKDHGLQQAKIRAHEMMASDVGHPTVRNSMKNFIRMMK